jgi:3-phenylpropionate/trans-cinnamate dioxygenase ferredoxin subunit
MTEWVRVADVSQCSGEGCTHAVSANGEAVVLAQWEGEIFALEDCCSHEDFLLSEGTINDGRIECVLHGAMFDLRTGKAVRLPAVRPVRTYPVRIENGEIFVEVDS